MHKLSISKAWEETKDIVARDGKLLGSVALALIALPTALTGLINPRGVTGTSPLSVDIMMLIASLVAIAGQLALIRLALGPSVTVGGAIGHGFQRMPIYLVAAIIILCGLLIAAIPFVLILALLGVPLDTKPANVTPAGAIILLAYMAVVIFIGFRMVLAAPVASAEKIGPIAILKRSWALTSGHWWQLFGFVITFFIASLIVLIAVNAAVGLAVAIAFGPIEPMSLSALVTALVQALLNAVITTLFGVMLARIYIQLSGLNQASVPSSGI